MAQGISQRFGESSQILLIGPVGPKLKELLSPDIKIPPKCLTPNDEVHLILEYNAKEIFEGGVHAPHANRFIISHDVYNSRMEMLDDFFNITNDFQPDITILSGLHLLESQSPAFR